MQRLRWMQAHVACLLLLVAALVIACYLVAGADAQRGAQLLELVADTSRLKPYSIEVFYNLRFFLALNAASSASLVPLLYKPDVHAEPTLQAVTAGYQAQAAAALARFKTAATALDVEQVHSSAVRDTSPDALLPVLIPQRNAPGGVTLQRVTLSTILTYFHSLGQLSLFQKERDFSRDMGYVYMAANARLLPEALDTAVDRMRQEIAENDDRAYITIVAFFVAVVVALLGTGACLVWPAVRYTEQVKVDIVSIFEAVPLSQRRRFRRAAAALYQSVAGERDGAAAALYQDSPDADVVVPAGDSEAEAARAIAAYAHRTAPLEAATAKGEGAPSVKRQSYDYRLTLGPADPDRRAPAFATIARKFAWPVGFLFAMSAFFAAALILSSHAADRLEQAALAVATAHDREAFYFRALAYTAKNIETSQASTAAKSPQDPLVNGPPFWEAAAAALAQAQQAGFALLFGDPTMGLRARNDGFQEQLMFDGPCGFPRDRAYALVPALADATQAFSGCGGAAERSLYALLAEVEDDMGVLASEAYSMAVADVIAGEPAGSPLTPAQADAAVESFAGLNALFSETAYPLLGLSSALYLDHARDDVSRAQAVRLALLLGCLTFIVLFYACALRPVAEAMLRQSAHFSAIMLLLPLRTAKQLRPAQDFIVKNLSRH
jgi:hypothetical protein